MKVSVTNSPKGFPKLQAFLDKVKKPSFSAILKRYGDRGVDALAAATPYRTGLTASSWGYEIKESKGTAEITFTNSNINEGVPIAIILQYGHGTRNGGYVQGIDYINPALRPIFEDIATDAFREVTE